MERMRCIIMMGLVATLLIGSITAMGEDVASESSSARDKRMRWWREARFGMFIHWGVYSVPAGYYKGKPVGGIGEWIMDKGKIPIPEYEEFAKQFNPQKFNALEWVRIAKDAGMKYIVITSKHHDGFCLWDSKVTDYDIMDFTPFKRDILKELAEACKKEKIKLCFYHSIMDWHHPDAKGENWSKYRDDYMVPQLKELLSDYGDIGVIWFDGEWIGEWTEPQGKELYKLLLDINPDLIVNNRVGKGRKGMSGMSDEEYSGDFGTPEQEIPSKGLPGVDWESCMTMNGTWGFKKDDHGWKTEEDLIHKLIDIASKGGNFLLNVGPTDEGLIPGPSVDRLSSMGEWLKANGEAIYGTSASPFKGLSWGRCTSKPGRIYLHVFDWPKEGIIELPLLSKVKKAYLLADSGTKLAVRNEDDKVVIELPAEMPDKIATVIVLKIRGDIEVRPPEPIAQKADGSLLLKAEDAEVTGSARYESGAERDCIGYWSDESCRAKWEFKVTKPGKYVVEVTFACPGEHKGSKYEVAIGSEKVSGTVVETGDWGKFVTEKAGTIELGGEGQMKKAIVRGYDKPGDAIMNLRSVALRPVK